MFGFSITKLLFTIVAIVVIWQGFKWFGRMQENRELGSQNKKKKTESANAGHDGVEDMVKCATCDTFVSRSTRSCGRADCPYPG